MTEIAAAADRQAVPYERYRALLHRAAESAELLNAIEMFSGPGAVDTVRQLNDLINAVDQRLGELEKRLDAAGIKAAVIPDDECEKYFTLPLLGQP